MFQTDTYSIGPNNESVDKVMKNPIMEERKDLEKSLKSKYLT